MRVHTFGTPPRRAPPRCCGASITWQRCPRAPYSTQRASLPGRTSRQRRKRLRCGACHLPWHEVRLGKGAIGSPAGRTSHAHTNARLCCGAGRCGWEPRAGRLALQANAHDFDEWPGTRRETFCGESGWGPCVRSLRDRLIARRRRAPPPARLPGLAGTRPRRERLCSRPRCCPPTAAPQPPPKPRRRRRRRSGGSQLRRGTRPPPR